MIQFPRYLPDQNALVVPNYPVPFPAGSLVAAQSGDMLAIASPVDGSLICQWASFDQWVMADGTVFPDAATAFTQLDAVCRQKRLVGETFGTPTVASTALVQGMPVAVSRANGQLLAARGDTYALSFVAGVASADTATGFTNQPAHGAVTLADWTDVTGRSALFSGVPYFLGAQGGLTISPFATPPQCVTRVGHAASPTTLIVAPTDPIQL